MRNVLIHNNETGTGVFLETPTAETIIEEVSGWFEEDPETAELIRGLADAIVGDESLGRWISPLGLSVATGWLGRGA